MTSQIEVSILMPCLNEAKTLGICIQKANGFLERNNIAGEIVIADNGSTDGSQDIARQLGARVIAVPEKGYGNALRDGIEAAKGKYIIMGDSDDSYDFSNLSPFVEKLRAGYDLVMGNRFKGGVASGAMPPLHKYLGNPVLSFIGRFFFKSKIKDFHCGLRGFKKSAALRMDLRTAGMEFASEMIIKATLLKMKTIEVATTLSPDGRDRPPHLRSWRDGWRHLQFMLFYCPNWLFLFPGMFLMLIGLILSARLVLGPIIINEINLDIQSLLFALSLIIIGFQSFLFAAFTKVFAITEGLLPATSRLMRVFKYITLEIGVIIGVFFLLIGLSGAALSFYFQSLISSAPENTQIAIRLFALSVTAIILGTQIILGSFFLSILGLKRKNNPVD